MKYEVGDQFIRKSGKNIVTIVYVRELGPSSSFDYLCESTFMREVDVERFWTTEYHLDERYIKLSDAAKILYSNPK